MSYGIAEWYGEPLENMSVARRQALAKVALDQDATIPRCPFHRGNVTCSKRGGVCSIRLYRQALEPPDAQIGEPIGLPVITCPNRFDQGNLVPKWLAEVVGFDAEKSFLAREVPFMRAPGKARSAGRIDLVLANPDKNFRWFGLEIQAVYFSGDRMPIEFENLANYTKTPPPFPNGKRRPDWRSSSAKRLMPQLEIKAPTLRRWGTKLAVAVDAPFFEAIGGPSSDPSKDLNDGDIIWLVPRVSDTYQLEAVHWEVLSLEDSSKKLLSAETIKRSEFEAVLRDKLRPLVEGGP